jgi:hypothetical protein
VFDIPSDGREVSVIRFDRDGRIVEQRLITKENERINILPGNVIVYRFIMKSSDE